MNPQSEAVRAQIDAVKGYPRDSGFADVEEARVQTQSFRSPNGASGSAARCRSPRQMLRVVFPDRNVFSPDAAQQTLKPLADCVERVHYSCHK